MKSSLQHKPDFMISRSKCRFVITAFFLILSASVSVALGGDSPLSSHANMKQNTSKGEKMVKRIVTEEDNGREIELAAGDIVRVDLRFQGGSGYSWYPDLPDGGQVQLIDSRSVDLSEEGMVGGPAIGMWYFKALAPGNITLTMLHYRVWEGRTKANKSFSVKLRVIGNREGR